MANPATPLVSIVILNWNGLEKTKACLKSVFDLDYPNFEVVVVDNGSSADEKEYLSKLKNIKYVDNPVNRGFTGGHIDGLRRAEGEYILLLNNDAVVKRNYLKVALKCFEDSKVAAVGGRAYFWNETNEAFDEASPYYSYQEIDISTGEARTLQFDYGFPQIVNNVSGSAVLVKRAVIDQVGYFYDPFFAYFEETDLFARMKRAGYKILYHPELRIWHQNGASSGSSGGSHFFYYQIFRNRLIFAVRNFEVPYLRRFLRNYLKIALRSALSLILGRGNRVMNYAYLKAALNNFFKMPKWLVSRAQITRQLGKTDYVKQIYVEQSGVSVIIDCREKSESEVREISARVTSADQNAMHEYILIVRGDNYTSELRGNIRFVTDREYFNTNPLNLGCIAARFPWILVSASADKAIDLLQLDESIKEMFATNKHVEAKFAPNGKILSILFTRGYFLDYGALEGRNFETAARQLYYYAVLDRKLCGKESPKGFRAVLPISIDEKRQLLQRLNFNTDLIKSKRPGVLARLAGKNYRFFQALSFVRWLIAPSVPIRTKLGRSLRLFKYAATLNRRAVATEIKHIRNELIIYGQDFATGTQVAANKKKALSRALKSPHEIPVFLICYERVETLKRLVDWLESVGMKKIVFIDNNSSYPPLLEYYDRSPHQVIRLYRNSGHRVMWSEGVVRALVPQDYYIVSDPDILPSEECPKDVVRYFLTIHKRYPQYEKVGFGLKIDDLPDHFPLKKSAVDWEQQFWKHQMGPGLFEAGIDTTFAVYKPYTYKYGLHPSIRTGPPYLARHLPWYEDPRRLNEEERYYRAKADRGITSWNVSELPERYRKELKK